MDFCAAFFPLKYTKYSCVKMVCPEKSSLLGILPFKADSVSDF